MSMTRDEQHEHRHGHTGHDMDEHAGHDMGGHAGHDMSGHDGHDGHDMSGHDGHAGHDMASHGTSSHAGHDMSGHGGHGGHAGHGDHVGQFRRLFWVMLVFAVPTIAFSPMFAAILGYPLPDNGLVPWISPVLAPARSSWAGRPFLTGAGPG